MNKGQFAELLSKAVPCHHDHCRHYDLAHGKPCYVEAARIIHASASDAGPLALDFMNALNNERQRVRECLAYIEANPTANYPKGWIDEVRSEARMLGLLPPEKPRIGQNCKGQMRHEPSEAYFADIAGL